MNFCIEVSTMNSSEVTLDSIEIKKYLNDKFSFNSLNDKQLKKKIIEIMNTEDLILQILDDIDISFKYFIEIIYTMYPIIFTTSFINKHIKNTYQKYKDF